jgi:hypothetical protein
MQYLQTFTELAGFKMGQLQKKIGQLEEISGKWHTQIPHENYLNCPSVMAQSLMASGLYFIMPWQCLPVAIKIFLSRQTGLMHIP